MYYLIIDTCVWIELGREYIEIREKISDLVDRGKVILIVPQVIVEEWNKHKRTKIIESKKAFIRGIVKSARTMAQYLPAEDAAELTRMLDQFQEQKTEIEDAASAEVRAIDSLFDHPSTIRLPVTEKAKSQAVDLALAKRAPFQNKNSMADALIVLCAADHIVKDNLADCVFVSSNTKDFALDSDVHPDLKDLFEQCGMQYSANIASTINKIEKDLVSQEVVEEIDRRAQLAAMWEAYAERREELARLMSTISELRQSPALMEVSRQREELARLMSTIGELRQSPALMELSRLREELAPLMSTISELRQSPALMEVSRQREELARLMSTISELRQSPALMEVSRLREELARLMSTISESIHLPTLMEAAERRKKVAVLEESRPNYVASATSNRFHLPSCRYAQRVLPENRVSLASREEAIIQGYSACEVCKP